MYWKLDLNGQSYWAIPRRFILSLYARFPSLASWEQDGFSIMCQAGAGCLGTTEQPRYRLNNRTRYLLTARVTKIEVSFVSFYFSDLKEGLGPVRERHQSLEDYLVEQKRVALTTIRKAATSCWPSSITNDPMTVGGAVETDYAPPE
ncbi:hypothetical protein F4782DRAFT_368274 [Xylaria castorea]|nr:hypothetical protein F4782DRAFT_368274 [Xylaria castorea]